VVDEDLDWKKMAGIKETSETWLRSNRVKAFLAVTRADRFSEGARVAVELSGLGKLSPNMMLIGFKGDWMRDTTGAFEYHRALCSAIDLHLAVGVLRVSGGLDVTTLFGHGRGVLATMTVKCHRLALFPG